MEDTERITRRLQEWANNADLKVGAYNAVHRIANEIEHECAEREDAAYADGAAIEERDELYSIADELEGARP